MRAPLMTISRSQSSFTHNSVNGFFLLLFLLVIVWLLPPGIQSKTEKRNRNGNEFTYCVAYFLYSHISIKTFARLHIQTLVCGHFDFWCAVIVLANQFIVSFGLVQAIFLLFRCQTVFFRLTCCGNWQFCFVKKILNKNCLKWNEFVFDFYIVKNVIDIDILTYLYKLVLVCVHTKREKENIQNDVRNWNFIQIVNI